MSRNEGWIYEFDLKPGRVLAGRYVVEDLLGWGWEGEVYRVVERSTGIKRAAKLFYPMRNRNDRAVKFYANKLHRLRRCDIVIQYHHSVPIRFKGHEITCLISELVEGKLWSRHVADAPGKRLPLYEALHLLYALVCGLEQIHRANEYHGDLHDDNVLVRRRGIGFELKLVDFFQWGAATREKRRQDVQDAIRLFYDAVGGKRWYARQPPVVKTICCGLRRSRMAERFPTVTHLREFLESFDW
ncbi:MAG: serine/threonine protein kinase [Planctomycetota bacterium]|nr:MAG: serine/threonine protein kinase [Planctomycetota bacterium]